MPEFTVTWTIEVTANDHHTAARKAQRIHRDPASEATTFEVRGESGEPVLVDLQEDNQRTAYQVLVDNLTEYGHSHVVITATGDGRTAVRVPLSNGTYISVDDFEGRDHAQTEHFGWEANVCSTDGKWLRHLYSTGVDAGQVECLNDSAACAERIDTFLRRPRPELPPVS